MAIKYSAYSNIASATSKYFFEVDGNTVAWYDWTDLTTITKDASERISKVADKLGSGHDLLQAGADATKPTYTADGIFNDKTKNQFLKTNAFDFNRPEFIYLVIKQNSWTISDYLIDGNAVQTGALFQYDATPELCVRAGALSGQNANLAVGVWGIVRILFNGASSKLQINATAATTGNFGAANMGGITIGHAGTGGAYADINWKEAIFRKVADSAPNEAIIYNYLKAKYSL
jgi:hypothetical protein